jgi:lactoylglutathione lyase
MPIETMTSANVKQAVPFFGVTDMEASLRFYVDGLGFKMKALVDSRSG